jgi:ATP-dependent RNA helicase DDX54/DBP10
MRGPAGGVLCCAGLKDPVLVRLDVDTKLSDDLRLSFYHVRKVDKLPVLVHILQTKACPPPPPRMG